MFLSCPICADVISPSDENRVTKCGHMFHNHCLSQWLDRSTTCPQCRQECRTSTAIRLYMNQSLNESLDSVEHLKLTLLEQTRKTKQVEEKLDDSRYFHMQSKLEIDVLENLQTLLFEYIGDLHKDKKKDNRRIFALEEKTKVLKTNLMALQSVDQVIRSSPAEVASLMGSNHSTKSLCMMVVTLKYNQSSIQDERFALRQSLKKSEAECRSSKNIQKQQQRKITTLESDYNQLQSQFNELQVQSMRRKVLPSMVVTASSNSRVVRTYETSAAAAAACNSSQHLNITRPVIRSVSSIPVLASRSLINRPSSNQSTRVQQPPNFKKPRIAVGAPYRSNRFGFSAGGGNERRNAFGSGTNYRRN